MHDGETVRTTARQVVLGALGVAGVTLACFPLHVNFAIPAFLYLLTVVLRSQAGGFVASAIVSVIAVLCLDYFFTPPILQLEVASPIDAMALVTCLVTSLIITRLATEARHKALSAERRREALARLYEVVWRLFSVEPQAVSGAGTLQIYRDVLDLEAVCLFDANAATVEVAGNAGARLMEETRKAGEQVRDLKDPASQTWIQSLQVAGKHIGAIGFQGLSDAESMGAPLSMLAGAALERAESFRTASEAGAISRAESLRSAIADAFAHQFKTPLAAILTAAGGIRETHELTVQQAEMIEMIEAETVRLSRLATRLLVTARLDGDAVQPQLEPTNLTDLIVHTIDQVPSEGRRVLVDLCTDQIQVASDRELLTLAVAQLLDNAFKYSPLHAPVCVRLTSRDGVARIRVSNHGGVVPLIERERIFERFYRGAAAAKLAPGTGLGLYVARKIVHAHGGSLELEEYAPQAPDTTFCIKLPILKTEPQYVGETS